MPTYDYQCAACGHEMELFQSMTAKPIKKCPECGKLKLKRLIGTGAGVLFKGDGFWQTDYRSESYKAGAKAEKGDSGGGEKKGDKQEGKGESSKDSGAEKKSEPKGGEAKKVKKEGGGKSEKKSGKPKK